MLLNTLHIFCVCVIPKNSAGSVYLMNTYSVYCCPDVKVL